MVTVEPRTPAADIPAHDPEPVNADHPDPVTLTEPLHDDQGLLRWTTGPRALQD